MRHQILVFCAWRGESLKGPTRWTQPPPQSQEDRVQNWSNSRNSKPPHCPGFLQLRPAVAYDTPEPCLGPLYWPFSLPVIFTSKDSSRVWVPTICKSMSPVHTPLTSCPHPYTQPPPPHLAWMLLSHPNFSPKMFILAYSNRTQDPSQKPRVILDFSNSPGPFHIQSGIKFCSVHLLFASPSRG